MEAFLRAEVGEFPHLESSAENKGISVNISGTSAENRERM